MDSKVSSLVGRNGAESFVPQGKGEHGRFHLIIVPLGIHDNKHFYKIGLQNRTQFTTEGGSAIILTPSLLGPSLMRLIWNSRK